MSLESVVGFGVVEDLFKRRILQRGTVNITGDPVVVEHRCALRAFFSISIVKSNKKRLTISSWYM